VLDFDHFERGANVFRDCGHRMNPQQNSLRGRLPPAIDLIRTYRRCDSPPLNDARISFTFPPRCRRVWNPELIENTKAQVVD